VFVHQRNPASREGFKSLDLGWIDRVVHDTSNDWNHLRLDGWCAQTTRALGNSELGQGGPDQPRPTLDI
jgi:hypothetical protein